MCEYAEVSKNWTYPIGSCDPGVWYMGYANVGTVLEVGDEVEHIKEGDLVYTPGAHQSQIVKSESVVLKLPDTISPEKGIFLTNLMTAYNGILDADIKLGDTVVVSGLGVLGQMVMQLAKLSGALQVIGIDLVDRRLQACLQLLGKLTLEPLITHRLAHDQIATAYEMIDTQSNEVVQVAITYP